MLAVCGLGLLSSPGRAESRVYGSDLAGHAVALPGAGASAAVLFFVASDCPISNRYFPEMVRLEEEFAGKGVSFWFVYPNLTETPPIIRAHQGEYAPGGHVLTDPQQRLAQFTGAKVTPEAAILIAGQGGLRTVYAGRIDDRYLSIGKERPRATRHDLEDAIAAALKGGPVAEPGGPAVGCGIVSTK